MDEDEIVNETVLRVLDAAKDDWVDLVDIQSHLLDVAEEADVELWNSKHLEDVRYGRGEMDPLFEKRFDLGMRVVEALLKSGRMIPGEIPSGFMPWTGSVDEWLSRIAKDWRDFGASLSLNDVCWFALRS